MFFSIKTKTKQNLKTPVKDGLFSVPHSLSTAVCSALWGARLTHISYIYNIYKICHLGVGHAPASIAGVVQGWRWVYVSELSLCNRTAGSASARPLTVPSLSFNSASIQVYEDYIYNLIFLLLYLSLPQQITARDLKSSVNSYGPSRNFL